MCYYILIGININIKYYGKKGFRGKNIDIKILLVKCHKNVIL